MDEAVRAPLAKCTTLKIGGEADRLCHPHTVEELVETVDSLRQKGEPWFILGGGSNLLVSSQGFRGTVIRTTNLIEIKNPQPGVLEALAGARLPHLAKFAASIGLAGMEFAVGIPGTVGGGVIMNAGAHGSCMANILESATIFDSETGTLKELTKDDMQFQYRRCKLDPLKHVVVKARFRMEQGAAEEIEKRTKENEDYRWRTQPIGFPNAGSTFKNPEPQRTAGLLLDKAGAKELKEGGAAVSAMHANFVVNLGGATSNEVTTLLKRMQECVFKEFEVRLSPEWKTLGAFSEEELSIWRDSGH
ncbi:MAG: UDP-N-acetylmuramate dehydrogenase [Candidatus Obscuribacterales bacterium]|nr:UDP-N-acetylmuramate dehydrogenase [Candidatus Obscuribacterales bacterium]